MTPAYTWYAACLAVPQSTDWSLIMNSRSSSPKLLQLNVSNTVVETDENTRYVSPRKSDTAPLIAACLCSWSLALFFITSTPSPITTETHSGPIVDRTSLW